jgi:hypothetical protein
MCRAMLVMAHRSCSMLEALIEPSIGCQCCDLHVASEKTAGDPKVSQSWPFAARTLLTEL